MRGPPSWYDVQFLEAALPEGVWLFDGAWRTVYASAPMAAMLRLDLAELLDQPLARFVSPGWLDRFHEHMARRRQGTVEQREFCFRRADGSELWARLSTMPASGPGGEFVGALAVVVDDTRRHEAELARRCSDARLEAVFHSLPFDCWVMGPDGRYALQNPTSVEHWGQHVGETIDDSTLPAAVRELWRESNRRVAFGEIVRERREYVHRGERRVYDAFIAPILGGPEPGGSIGVNIDVTEQVRLERRLHEAEKLEALGRLAGGVAHDFNNLLTVVLSAASLLEPHVAAAGREDLQLIREAAQRGTELTRDLLSYARREPLPPSLVPVAPLVAGVERLLRRVLPHDITLRVEADGSTWSAWLNPAGLERAIMNLCINAREAMHEGGELVMRVRDEHVRATTAAVGSFVTPAAYVVVEVADTGTGMDADTTDHAFDPFFTTRAGAGGTGLGLASTYGFVRQASGHVILDTAPGAGTRIRLYFPRAEDLPDEHDAAPRTAAPARGARVLLVEDEERLRGVLVRVLQDEGFVVEAAGDPVEALARLARPGGERVDVVVSDVSTRGGAVALLDGLTHAGPHVPVLLVSGFSRGSPELAEHLASGRVGFLPKPFEPEALAAAIHRLRERAV